MRNKWQTSVKLPAIAPFRQLLAPNTCVLTSAATSARLDTVYPACNCYACCFCGTSPLPDVTHFTRRAAAVEANRQKNKRKKREKWAKCGTLTSTCMCARVCAIAGLHCEHHCHRIRCIVCGHIMEVAASPPYLCVEERNERWAIGGTHSRMGGGDGGV